MTGHIDFPGNSGKSYRYYFLDNPTAEGILAVPGNYGFLRRLQDGTFAPLYFGQGDDLKTRIPGHEKWDEARQLGMTHVVAHKNEAGKQARLNEEADLIAKWNPPLNIQGRTDKSKVVGR
jgi:hypothetical protein